MVDAKTSVIMHIKNALAAWAEEVPFIVGIGGPTAVGKTTFARCIEEELIHQGIATFLAGIDEFFESPEKRKQLNDWSREHIRIVEIKNMLSGIKNGKNIFQTEKYVRKPKRGMVPWKIELSEIKVVIFEGIYVLSNASDLGNLVEFVDLAIFMRADIEDLKKWRFAQENQKAEQRSSAEMERHWRESLFQDTIDNVFPSASNADLIINVDSNHEMYVTRGEDT